MLEIINNPETSEERRDWMIVAAAPYLHCKPSTPLFADNACKRYLNGSTSLTGSASPTDGTPFASVEEAMDYLRKNGAARGWSPDK